MSKSRGKASHILCLEGNSSGIDRVIGDVHGNRQTLDDVIAYMRHHDDRLFIAGDLTDRGPESLDVIETIVKHNKDYQKPGRIYCIRGNHEDMCLDTIHALEDLNRVFDMRISDERLEELRKKHQNDALSKAEALYLEILAIGSAPDLGEYLDDVIAIQHHCDPRNGGDWLVALYFYEVQLGYIANDNQAVVYHPQSRIGMIKSLIDNLPYIIHVQGDQPFNIVHADMPINDKKLQRRIHKKQGLTNKEIAHATWFRDSKRKSSRKVEKIGRDVDSIPAFVGHSIICEENVDSCVREKTHTINLDVESYRLGVAVVANMTDMVCEISNEVPVDHHLCEVMMRINQGLKEMPQKEKSRQLKQGREVSSSLYADKHRKVDTDSENDSSQKSIKRRS